MVFKDILVHVDKSKSSPARLNAAIRLAKTWEAKLTGAYILSKPYLPAYAEVQISPDILEAQVEELNRNAEEVEAAFRETIDQAGVNAEWRMIEGMTAEALTIHSRYFDLAIVGQGDPDDALFIGDREMPDGLVMSSGRPVLIIPYVGTFDTIGKNVMVAWDGGQQASRAVHDALPVLKAADNVTVMVVNPKGGKNGTGDLPGADMAAHLSRHGVNAEADHVTSDLDPGDMLLSRAADKSIDLLVMGTYGHARWTELILGGVTNHMLTHMTVPVLTSH
ncbi:MAG: universal stress protein [Alphaproteobacteria bacterium]|jgi:nucleotide-binding universal stress UspA family protein|nr:universal stress protein [Alphaproteobacteria bacterium]